jgi:hypothetical protein
MDAERHAPFQDEFEGRGNERGQRLAEQTTQKILSLLKPGVSIKSVAELLGGSEFLVLEQVRGSREPVLRFKVKEFVEKLAEERELDVMSEAVLPEEVRQEQNFIIPPDAGELNTGNGEGIEPKAIIPRSRYLIEALSELNTPYDVYDGIVSKNTFRKLSYKAFVIQDLDTVIFVNNEEGNATFIVRDVSEGQWREYASMTKEQLKALGPDKVAVVHFDRSPDEWKQRILDVLMYRQEKDTRRTAQTEAVLAPEGWLKLKDVIKKVRSHTEITFDETVVVRLIKKHLTDHPEWSAPHLSTNERNERRVSKHYHPDLIKKVIDELSERRMAPPGWMNETQISKQITAASRSIVGDLLKKFAATEDELFGYFITPTNKNVLRYYNPVLIRRIEQELSTRIDAPDKWLNVREIHMLTGFNKTTVRRFIKRITEEHPEWEELYIGRNYREILWHYHPKLVETIINEKVLAYEIAPPGWMNTKEIRVMTKRNLKLIKQMIRQYIVGHPDWKHPYRSRNNNAVCSHYHPELIEKLKEELSERKTAPDKWMNLYELSKQIGVGRKTIKRLADKLLVDHPDWEHPYEGRENRVVLQHYHPDLIEKIKEELKK